MRQMRAKTTRMAVAMGGGAGTSERIHQTHQRMRPRRMRETRRLMSAGMRTSDVVLDAENAGAGLGVFSNTKKQVR